MPSNDVLKSRGRFQVCLATQRTSQPRGAQHETSPEVISEATFSIRILHYVLGAIVMVTGSYAVL